MEKGLTILLIIMLLAIVSGLVLHDTKKKHPTGSQICALHDSILVDLSNKGYSPDEAKQISDSIFASKVRIYNWD